MSYGGMTPAGQRWTRRRPTKPGFYWWRGFEDWRHYTKRLEVVKVSLSPAGYPNMEVPGVYGYHPAFNDPDSEFLGPLTPNEATE